MNPDASPSMDSLAPVRDRLSGVLAQRDQISAELRECASRFLGRRRQQLLELSRCFNQLIDAEDLLRRPDAIAICLPLLRRDNEKEIANGIEHYKIENAVRIGAERLAENSPARPPLFGLLVYPLALLTMCSVLLVAFSVLIVPEFEKMFNEFGLSLPAATWAVITVSHWIRRLWILMPVVGVIAAIVVIGYRFFVRSEFNSIYGSYSFAGLMTSTRAAWAQWAWHLAMLLELGVSQADAVAVAGQSSRKSWLKRCSTVWSDQLRRGGRPFDVFTHLDGHPIHTLGYALRLPNLADQASVLNGVAANYWDRERNRSRWWVAWLTPVTVCVVGTIFGNVIAALLMPLVQLIRGLT